MSIRKAVFPVAGLGTRLLPATKSQPKEMLPVGCKPVVQYVVEEMIEQGLDKFLFVTGRKKRSIEDHFDDDPELEARLGDSAIDEVDYAAEGVEFYYVRQRRPTGNADAVRHAREFVGDEPFVVGFGDTIIASPRVPGVVGRMMESHVQRGAAATIAVWEVPREETYKYGVVTPRGEVDEDFAIADIVEKPSVEAAPSCLAVAARYIFSPEIFAAIDEIEPGGWRRAVVDRCHPRPDPARGRGPLYTPCKRRGALRHRNAAHVLPGLRGFRLGRPGVRRGVSRVSREQTGLGIRNENKARLWPRWPRNRSARLGRGIADGPE